MKIIIASNKIDISTKLEVLLGLKLSGHTDALSEAIILEGEISRNVEIQSEQQYEIAPDMFYT